jgi:hypothetical protein
MAFSKYYRKLFLGVLTCDLLASAKGQGTAETMIQQIAALQTYIHIAEQGYSTTERGLAAIRAIRQGEFDLHTAFFQSLSTVSPDVINMPDVVSALHYQQAITTALGQATGNFRTSSWLQASEKSYWQRFNTTMTLHCRQKMDALQTLLSDGSLQMTDGQRMNAITSLTTDLRQRYEFVIAFISGTWLLIGQREDTGAFISTLSKMEGL